MQRRAIVLLLAVTTTVFSSCHLGPAGKRPHPSTEGAPLRSASDEKTRASQAFTPDPVPGQQKLGLIIVAHGSPAPQWNEPVLTLEGEVQALLNESENNPFVAIRVAMMEFAKPTIETVITDMELQGVQRVYVAPLFIAPSGHSVYDLPTILGLYSDQEMRDQLREEGIGLVSTDIRITLGPTLDYGSILEEVMLDRLRELSVKPQSEGIVLLAHGNHHFRPIWESVCGRIGAYLCAHAGIPHFKFAFVEVGQSFIPEGVPAILEVAKRCERTLVLGLYLSTGIRGIAQSSTLSVGGMSFQRAAALEEYDIAFASQGLLPSERLARWIALRSLEWAAGQR